MTTNTTKRIYFLARRCQRNASYFSALGDLPLMQAEQQRCQQLAERIGLNYWDVYARPCHLKRKTQVAA